MDVQPTASIVVVGDEILTGEVRDQNSQFLCRELHQCGVKVSRISVLPDNIDAVAEEVTLSSDKFNYVLTTGGAGVSHNVVYLGIAKAFSDGLVVNKHLCDALKRCYPRNGFSEQLISKLSWLPKSCEIHLTLDSHSNVVLPVLSVGNVFVFPGVPSSLQSSFMYLKSMFLNRTGLCNCMLYLDAEENVIRAALKKVTEQFGDGIRFRATSAAENSSCKVKVTLETDSEDSLSLAEAYFRSLFHNNTVVSPIHPKSNATLKEFSSILYETSSGDDDLISVLGEAVDVLRTCMKNYATQNICLSFNGGKDCTALLHILSCILQQENIKGKLKVLYICSKEPFLETEDFIRRCVERYELELITYDYPIKDAVGNLKRDHPEVEAIFMGTRRTDPRASHLNHLQATDSNWPSFMRVSPLLHWEYQHVWQFLRQLNIPYCSLYDRGYTSLGCRNNTMPNPKLKTVTPKGETFFCPAYLLKESSKEREGRVSSL